MWKLKAEDAEGKAAAVAAIAAALEPLANEIAGISSLRVHANSAFFDVNWDAALIGDYDSLAALEAYQVHPSHVVAAAIVREYTAQRTAVDIEL